ncbi:MAG: porin, partial [Duodenibacillus sp.]|nr:porin [Duodenibacillus sp.]
NDGTTRKDTDDSIEVTLGGSYDFGVVKVFAAAQYFDDYQVSSFNSLKNSTTATYIKGYGLNLSASAPLAGGTAICGLGWVDAENAAKNTDQDIERIGFSMGYTYPLSKRTNLYAVAGVGQDKDKTSETVKTKYYKAGFGLRHRF